MIFSDDFLNENSFPYFDNENLKLKVQKCKEYVSRGQTIAFLDNIEETIQLCIEYDLTDDGIFLTEAALEISPYSSELWHSRGIFFNNLFEFEKAYVCFDKALSLNPSDVETMINKAIAEDNLGLGESAIKTLQDALSLEPSNEEILFNLGIFYERTDSLKKAIHYFEQTVKIDPEYSDAWYELGFSFETNGDLEKSLEAYKKFLEIDPYSASGWYNLGIINLKLTNTKEAINNFELAVTLNDDFVNAWYNLGIAYTKNGNYAGARKSFLKAYEQDPLDYSIPLSIAQSFEAVGEYEKAADYFKEALRLSKSCTEAYIGLGNYYSRNNNVSAMLDYFSQFIRYSLAQKVKIGSPKESDQLITKIYNELFDLESEGYISESNLLKLAEINFNLGRWETAVLLFTDLLEKYSDKSEIFYSLALCSFMLREDEKAIKYLISSFDLNARAENIFLEDFPKLESTQLYISIFNTIFF